MVKKMIKPILQLPVSIHFLIDLSGQSENIHGRNINLKNLYKKAREK